MDSIYQGKKWREIGREGGKMNLALYLLSLRSVWNINFPLGKQILGIEGHY